MESGDGPADVLAAAGVPKRGDAHPDDTLALCQQVEAEQASTDDFEEWFIVTATYGTLNVGGPPPTDGEEDDPLTAPIVVTWSRELITEPMDRGYSVEDDKRDQTEPITTSAFERYDPPPLKDRIVRVLTIQKNEASFSVSTVDAYANHVNRYPWYGFDEETVLFTGADAQSVWNGTTGSYYYSVTYNFKIDAGEWVTSLLDHGVYAYIDGTRQHITENNDPIVTPRLLDGNGGVLDFASPSDNPLAFYNAWYTYPRKNLNDLGVVS